MNGNGLFAIDVGSEIRSLSDAQLRGPWQMPAEIVRFAVRSGAREISVTNGWRGFHVLWKGGAIARPILEDLATALDDSVESSIRQQAITALESSGAEALMWAGGAVHSRLQIDGESGGIHAHFTSTANRAPRLVFSDSTSAAEKVAVQWKSSIVDRRRAERWLRVACRFSEVEISVDGQPVSRGFPGGLYRMRVSDPLRCTIGLTRHGEEPVLWLLRDGIVAARAVLPGYPPFEAAVELGTVVSGAASSSDLRQAVVPYVSDVCDHAVDMMIEVAGRPNVVTGPDGQRLIALLLRAARRDLKREVIWKLPLFPNTSEPSRLLSWSSLETVARRRAGRLFSVAPGDGCDGVLADAETTIVVSPEVRNLLLELTGVCVQPAPRRRIGVVRRLAGGARGLGVHAVERGLGMIKLGILAPGDLSAGERRTLELLRAALSPRTVDFGTGGRLRRTATGFIVPRRDPAVVGAVARTAEDPAWLYPLVLALKLDLASFGSLRKEWIDSLESRPE